MMLSAIVMGLSLCAGNLGASESPGGEGGQGLFSQWVAKHLSVGLHVTRFWLEETRRPTDHGYDNTNIQGNFLGSLWGIDEKQHYFPNPFVEYRFVSSFGLGVAYDQSRARTLDWGNAEQTITSGDGDLEIRGLQFYVLGRYPNKTRFAPFANAGFGRYHATFYETAEWKAGSPGRHFVVNDTNGWFLALGCNVALAKHLGLDGLYRHSQIHEVSGCACADEACAHPRCGAFPMRNNLLGIGVAYGF